MGVGHTFTDASTLAHFLWDIVLQISSLHPLPLSCFLCQSEETGRLRSALGPSPGNVREDMVEVKQRGSSQMAPNSPEAMS